MEKNLVLKGLTSKMSRVQSTGGRLFHVARLLMGKPRPTQHVLV